MEPSGQAGPVRRRPKADRACRLLYADPSEFATALAGPRCLLPRSARQQAVAGAGKGEKANSIDRFDTRQQFCSDARLCGAGQTSDNKPVGVGNRKAGNAWLKWAFSEAAVLSAQKDEQLGRLLGRLQARLGKGQGAQRVGPQAGAGLLPPAAHERGL